MVWCCWPAEPYDLCLDIMPTHGEAVPASLVRGRRRARCDALECVILMPGAWVDRGSLTSQCEVDDIFEPPMSLIRRHTLDSPRWPAVASADANTRHMSSTDSVDLSSRMKIQDAVVGIKLLVRYYVGVRTTPDGNVLLKLHYHVDVRRNLCVTLYQHWSTGVYHR